jgi:NADH-quinone oxidoreductase subunit H
MKFEGISILYSVLKYVAILVVITVIRNTNPRLRIDQAMRFFWGPVTGIAVIAVVLAVIGW